MLKEPSVIELTTGDLYTSVVYERLASADSPIEISSTSPSPIRPRSPGTELSPVARSLITRLYRRMTHRINRSQSERATRHRPQTPVSQLATTSMVAEPITMRSQWNATSLLHSRRQWGHTQGSWSRVEDIPERTAHLGFSPSEVSLVLVGERLIAKTAVSLDETQLRLEREKLKTIGSSDDSDTLSTRRRRFRNSIGRARELYIMLGRFDDFFDSKTHADPHKRSGSFGYSHVGTR